MNRSPVFKEAPKSKSSLTMKLRSDGIGTGWLEDLCGGQRRWWMISVGSKDVDCCYIFSPRSETELSEIISVVWPVFFNVPHDLYDITSLNSMPFLNMV